MSLHWSSVTMPSTLLLVLYLFFFFLKKKETRKRTGVGAKSRSAGAMRPEMWGGRKPTLGEADSVLNSSGTMLLPRCCTIGLWEAGQQPRVEQHSVFFPLESHVKAEHVSLIFLFLACTSPCWRILYAKPHALVSCFLMRLSLLASPPIRRC